MKKNYVQPATTVVSVAAHGHILDGGSVQRINSNSVGIGFGGASSNNTSGQARVKDATEVYDVWDDDWQGQ